MTSAISTTSIQIYMIPMPGLTRGCRFLKWDQTAVESWLDCGLAFGQLLRH
jgi:hypothetical protein